MVWWKGFITSCSVLGFGLGFIFITHLYSLICNWIMIGESHHNTFMGSLRHNSLNMADRDRNWIGIEASSHYYTLEIRLVWKFLYSFSSFYHLLNFITSLITLDGVLHGLLQLFVSQWSLLIFAFIIIGLGSTFSLLMPTGASSKCFMAVWTYMSKIPNWIANQRLSSIWFGVLFHFNISVERDMMCWSSLNKINSLWS